jgi:hypothetical protein
VPWKSDRRTMRQLYFVIALVPNNRFIYYIMPFFYYYYYYYYYFPRNRIRIYTLIMSQRAHTYAYYPTTIVARNTNLFMI